MGGGVAGDEVVEPVLGRFGAHGRQPERDRDPEAVAEASGVVRVGEAIAATDADGDRTSRLDQRVDRGSHVEP